MNAEQKQYIEQNIELIENNDWETFFSQAPIGVGLLLYKAGVNFLEDVSEILSRMFKSSYLTELVIPNNVTSIGEDAFYDCSSLISITIPNSVESIGDYAFYCCDKLTKAVVKNPNTTFGNDVFSYVSPIFEIHGHKNSTAEKYANENGHTFVSID